MGRKIPSKKHRGVKDPLEQQARRLQSLKGKINAPPKDPDDQPIPKSLERLFAFQNKKSPNLEEKKKKHNKTTNNRGQNELIKTDNPVAKLKKIPGESGRSFSLRINNAIKTLNNPSVDLDFPDDVEEFDSKGERMEFQRERRRRKKAKNGTESSEPQLSRSQKRAARAKAKKEKAEAQKQENRPELVYERVGFGEIVQAPPALSVKPRHAKADGAAARPGRRTLLLSAMLSGGAGAGAVSADAARRERTRFDVVAAYRELKKQNRERDKLKHR
ncbi:coiled-coil domain-containing protein 137 [Aricia agestis]|uniref:coiled-coil domain-containing protein 137 n=1 Tax=Aricia agestis TaxID=91739 RepID=UPI001C208365|nr:coiled-coil domain-containing protein 137 [Aricia agestis]